MWSSRSQVENPRHAKQLVQTNGESKRQKMKKTSEGAGARTLDLRIKSPLLYRLSYTLIYSFISLFHHKHSCDLHQQDKGLGKTVRTRLDLLVKGNEL